MISVTRKDGKESLENVLRRFNRKVQQSGMVAVVKQAQYFEQVMENLGYTAEQLENSYYRF